MEINEPAQRALASMLCIAYDLRLCDRNELPESARAGPGGDVYVNLVGYLSEEEARR
jgi:hypothetical protein